MGIRPAKEQAAKKKTLPALAGMRFEPFAEGKAVQVLHVGPYSEEAPTIERLHQFIIDQGRRLSGKHHEIYLSDPRRSDSAKLKTIIRQPLQPAPIPVVSRCVRAFRCASVKSEALKKNTSGSTLVKRPIGAE